MPTVYLKKDSGGAVLLVDGKVAISSGCCCGGCPYTLEIISAGISGTAASAEECGEVNIDLSGGDSGEAGDDCTATVTFPVFYTCPDDCYPVTEQIVRIDASLDGTDPSHWMLSLSSLLDSGDGDICGNVFPFSSAPMMPDDDLGADPTGDHVYSFPDGDEPSVTWDITVRIT